MNNTNNQDYLESFITEQEAANFAGFSVRSLQGWRLKGGGPKYSKVSARAVRYRRKDLIEWAENHMRNHTTEIVEGCHV